MYRAKSQSAHTFVTALSTSYILEYFICSQEYCALQLPRLQHRTPCTVNPLQPCNASTFTAPCNCHTPRIQHRTPCTHITSSRQDTYTQGCNLCLTRLPFMRHDNGTKTCCGKRPTRQATTCELYVAFTIVSWGARCVYCWVLSCAEAASPISLSNTNTFPDASRVIRSVSSR